MVLSQQLRDILALIAEKTHSNVSEFIGDTSIIDDVGLPEFETRKHLNELQSLDMIHIDQRVSGSADEKGREYRMIGITKEGIKAIASEDDIPR
jgi:hypothetical protein